MKKGTMMKKGIMVCMVELELRDAKGRLVKRRRFRSKSYVANFIRTLRRFAIGVTSTGSYGTRYYNTTGTEPVDTGGTARGFFIGAHTSTFTYNWIKMDAGSGDSTHGIRVGTGTSAPTPTDYDLGALIAHGTGAGQLQYGASTIEATQIVDSTTSFRIVRTFTNASGSTITVKEIGLVYSTYIASTTIGYIMIAKDLLGSPVDVLNGQTLTVRYIPSVTT